MNVIERTYRNTPDAHARFRHSLDTQRVTSIHTEHVIDGDKIHFAATVRPYPPAANRLLTLRAEKAEADRAFLEDLTWMLDTGETTAGAARRLGIRADTIARRLNRLGHRELASIFYAAHRAEKRNAA